MNRELRDLGGTLRGSGKGEGMAGGGVRKWAPVRGE